MEEATNIERIEILTREQVPEKLWRVDLRAIEYSPSSPTKHGFTASNPKQPFPSTKDSRARPSGNAPGSQDVDQNVFLASQDKNNFIALFGDWGAIIEECDTSKISGSKEIWRIYQVSTEKLQRLSIPIVEGKDVLSPKWDGETTTPRKWFHTFLIWGYVPAEAIEGSYAVGSNAFENREDRLRDIDTLDVPGLVAKEISRKHLQQLENQVKNYDLIKTNNPRALETSLKRASIVGNARAHVPGRQMPFISKSAGSSKGKERENTSLQPQVTPISASRTRFGNTSRPSDSFFVRSFDPSSSMPSIKPKKPMLAKEKVFIDLTKDDSPERPQRSSAAWAEGYTFIQNGPTASGSSAANAGIPVPGNALFPRSEQAAASNGGQDVALDQERTLLARMHALSAQINNSSDGAQIARWDIEYRQLLRTLEALRQRNAATPPQNV